MLTRMNTYEKDHPSVMGYDVDCVGMKYVTTYDKGPFKSLIYIRCVAYEKDFISSLEYE